MQRLAILPTPPPGPNRPYWAAPKIRTHACNVFITRITNDQEAEQGDPVLWIIPILIVAIAYEACDAASRFAGLSTRNTLPRQK